MATAVQAPASSEDSLSTATRVTRDGRKLSYQLNVLQQPDRARACGQGAKSSSDRRPVDPPPIVELHVFEGEEKRDITLTYNASLFLCATLEKTRAIANARGSHDAAGAPVLTGTPVAGISYLDRPVPAGYFIFTDLSVRSEGHYKLNFTLFEELKESKDQDMATNQQEHVSTQVYSRCAVSSRPFEVYSAKKFPGLTESTILSRVVADQGCRVRIRRDIRLRRRESKPGDKNWDEPQDQAVSQIEEAAEDPKQIIPSSPEVKAAAEKAASNANENSQALQAAYQHHAASQPAAYQANSGYAVPPAPQHMQQHYVYHQSQPQYGQPYPQQCQQQPQYMQQHQQHHQSYPQYPQYSHYNYQQQPGNSSIPPPPHYGYVQQGQPLMQQPQQPQMPQQQQQHNVYEQQPTTPQAMQMHSMRRESKSYSNGMSNEPQAYPGQPQSSATFGPTMDNVYNQPHVQVQAQAQQQQQQHHHAMMQQPNSAPLPTLKHSEVPVATATYPHSTAASPTAATSNSMQGFPPSMQQHGPRAAPPPPPPPPSFNTQPTAGYHSKRSYGSTFNTSHINQPLRGGARPTFNLDGASEMPGTLAVDPESANSDEDLQDLESIKLSYRRADGSWNIVAPRTF